MRLNQNMESLSVYKNYRKNLKAQSTTMERISSGNKINSSKDNPNKLGIRQGLSLQLRGLQMAEKNLQDSVSMMQSADGALSSVSEVLLRIKELNVQAGGTNDGNDLKIIQNEINQLKEHINATAENSEFNGVELLNSGNLDNSNPVTIKHMVGANVGETMDIPTFNVTTKALNLDDLDVTKQNGVGDGLDRLDEAINTVTSIRSKFGSIQNRMESTIDNIGESKTNIQSASSRIGDADIALEMAEYARTSIISESSLAILNQTNNFPKDILRVLENMK